MFIQKDLIYHRGRHGLVEVHGHFVPISENSLEAFRAAIDEDATMIEFDARKNSLGTKYNPIIAHDSGAENDVPTVIGALDLIQARCSVNVEIKDPSIWKGVMDLLTWYVTYDGWAPEQFVISTFHHPTAVLIKKHYPSFTVGAIMDSVPLLPYVTMLHKRGINNLHLEYMNADMDMQNGSAFMRCSKKLGMHVWVWTVNDLSTAERVHDWGAERIFTDRPNLFAK